MRSEITTIIFSKNRGCQLELLLRSMNMPASVIYASDDGFQPGYDKVIAMYPDVKFTKQGDFQKILIDHLVGDYIMFECDDDVMLEPFDEECPEFKRFKEDPKIICLSMRLCPRYLNDPPIFNSDNTWEWKGKLHSWGYPMSVTSHVFRKEDILKTIVETGIQIPNLVEVALRRNAPDRPLMLCFENPKFINNLANQVQTKFKSSRHAHIPVEELERRFMDGERLSLEDIKEKAKSAIDCFIKTEYKWERV